MGPVFSYTNYRKLMKDFYEGKKQENTGFSYQVFSRMAGFKTKSYLIEVVSGKKQLSSNSVFLVAKAMGLKKRETAYFEALVRFNESKTIDEREFYFEQLRTVSGETSASLLPVDKYQYFSEWYHPVIRELAVMVDFQDDFSCLAKMVKPALTARQAQESIALLLKLKLLQKKPDGRYCQPDTALTTGDEVSSLAIMKFQRESIKLAAEALDHCARETRDISTLTAGVSGEGYLTLKKEIQLFRKRLVQLIQQDNASDRVYQINFQLFPVSTPNPGSQK